MCQAGNGLRVNVERSKADQTDDDEDLNKELIALLGKPRSKEGLQAMAPTTIKKDMKGLNQAPSPTAGKGPTVTPPATTRGPIKVPGLG